MVPLQTSAELLSVLVDCPEFTSSHRTHSGWNGTNERQMRLVPVPTRSISVNARPDTSRRTVYLEPSQQGAGGGKE